MKEEYKALIIDDEPRARALLKGLLKEYCSDIVVTDECENLPNGVKAIRKQMPDLVFLDIEMPGHSGLELLEFFNEEEINFSIIFTTAYNQYAIQAFKLSAIDYLLKPIETTELENAIERFRRQHSKGKNNLNQVKEMMHQRPRKIAVPIANAIRFIELDQIMFLKADSSYAEVVFNNNQKLIVSRTLKNFEEVLENYPNFFRCHKSFIINTAFVSEFVKSAGGYVVMKDGTEIPVSPDKAQELVDQKMLVKR
ncbi:MAG: LytTR family DNA-binding domain-containing protein [Bacteroidia bacterium]|nr:LytTR family DNA-binding domain-containing protein [Bacteroidia bacterium]